MKNTIIMRILAFGLIAGLFPLMLGCFSQQYIANPDTSDLRDYQSHDVDVVTRAGSQYILKADWKSDSAGNITGEGSSLRHGDETPERFRGRMNASSVIRLTVQKLDKVKTAGVVVAAGLSIYSIVKIVEFVDGLRTDYQPLGNAKW